MHVVVPVWTTSSYLKKKRNKWKKGKVPWINRLVLGVSQLRTDLCLLRSKEKNLISKKMCWEIKMT